MTHKSLFLQFFYSPKLVKLRKSCDKSEAYSHKRKRLSSIDYNLEALQKGVDEERFADNEVFRCVLDVLKVMNENKQTKR